PLPQATVNRGSSSTQDEIRNYDVSRTTTTTVTRAPRLKRLSVAVLLDGVGGKARPEAEVARLGELAKRAVGFDASRGDELDISSAPFVRAEDVAAPAPAPIASKLPPTSWLAAAAAALVVIVILAALAFRRRPAPAPEPHALELVPGARVSELEARALGAAAALPAPKSPREELRDKAKALAAKDPARAAHVLKAWMSEGEPHA
ncbi:MAG: flagellar M-ring protein FliF C-terminal domain-containing protein, partial [Anaeromyxobacteraceae bacterium]